MTASERFAAVEFLRRAMPRIRQRAVAAGTQHSGWDLLGSIQHYTDGKPAYVFSGDSGLLKLVDMVKRDYPA